VKLFAYRRKADLHRPNATVVFARAQYEYLVVSGVVEKTRRRFVDIPHDWRKTLKKLLAARSNRRHSGDDRSLWKSKWPESGDTVERMDPPPQNRVHCAPRGPRHRRGTSTRTEPNAGRLERS